MPIEQLLSAASSDLQEGRFERAEGHYREALSLDPHHWDASFGLAQVLIRQKRFDEAIRWLNPLLGRPGDHAAVHRQLGLAHACVGRRQNALDHFKQVLEHEPDDAAILHVVANFQQALGLAREADATYRRAIQLKPLVTVPAAVTPPDFRALFIFGPSAGNTPIEYLIEHARFESNIFTLLQDMDYDVDRLRGYANVVVNLISDVDRGQTFLAPAQTLAERIGAPVINLPHLIAGTGRESIAQRLAPLAGCRVPQTQLYRSADLRALLNSASPDLPAFPLLVRPAGTHGGDNFEKMENPAQLQAFLSGHEPGSYYLSAFVDYQAEDGYFRKYRFFYVGDEILPYHLAIDDQWKVHHVSTSMATHTWMQDEERAFLDDPWQAFGEAQKAALRAIRETIGLDYFGIDCALDRDGAVVVFEANASMLVHGRNQQFPYKTAAVERIRRAFQGLLAQRAQQSDNPGI